MRTVAQLKEDKFLSLDDFVVLRKVGNGAFGMVLEVVKRDCGRHYAMKLQKKVLCQETFGDSWESVVSLEKQIMSTLDSPLLLHLAYAFQVINAIAIAVTISLALTHSSLPSYSPSLPPSL